MKKWKSCFTCLLLFLFCIPMSVSATSVESGSGTTDVYVGVTVVTKSNMKFLIVDETDVPIDGASIEIWANDTLKYQLLGVSHDGGIYEAAIPYGTYPYKVYKTGYQVTEQKLVLPNKENPHIEKVILKKETVQNSERPKEDGNAGNNGLIKTGDNARPIVHMLLAGISFMLIVLLYRKRRLADKKR